MQEGKRKEQMLFYAPHMKPTKTVPLGNRSEEWGSGTNKEDHTGGSRMKA